jgi:hypothetical protein
MPDKPQISINKAQIAIVMGLVALVAGAVWQVAKSQYDSYAEQSRMDHESALMLCSGSLDRVQNQLETCNSRVIDALMCAKEREAPVSPESLPAGDMDGMREFFVRFLGTSEGSGE